MESKNISDAKMVADDTDTDETSSDKQNIVQSDDNDNSVISSPNSNEIIKDNEFNNNCETTAKTKGHEIQNEFKVNNEISEIKSLKDNESRSDLPDMEKCDICGQFLNNSDIIYYQGHPQDAVEEFIALTNEKLVLASGKINSRLYLC